MSRFLSVIRNSAAFYPLTTLYIAAVLALEAAVSGLVRLDTAIIGLGIVTVILILASIYREVRYQRAEVKKVHTLVNSQRTELLERIEQLVAALQVAGVAVPETTRDTP
jgi:hypothetical protein